MRFSLVQFAASLDHEANLNTIDDLLAGIVSTDVVVLPEAAMRDFGSDDLAPIAQDFTGPFVQALQTHAARLGAVVIAGMFERTEDLPFNTVLAVDGEHILGCYRKIHLYDSFGYRESDRIQPGPIEPTVITVNDTRLGVMTCYDARFPEMARLLVDAGAEVLVVPSAWVAGDHKLAHWRTLLAARAIENTVPVVAAAQSGPIYTGHSLAYDAWGTKVVEAGSEPVVVTVDVDCDRTAEVRRENPSLRNRRIGLQHDE